MGRRLIVWPPLPPGIYAAPRAHTLPFPLEEPGCRLYARARYALLDGVRALGLSRGDEVLVPAYHHGSEIEALSRSGVTCRFYDAGPGLEPDPDEIEALYGRRTRGLYLIHPLGLPIDAPRWRAWCNDRGLFLLEDAAQAWLSQRDGRPVGSWGDLSVFCLYKTFGIADGAAVRCERPLPVIPVSPWPGVVHLAIRHGSYYAQRLVWLSSLREALDRPTYDPGRDIEMASGRERPFRSTARLLRRLVTAGAAAARLANYRFLWNALSDIAATAFPPADEGASPFAFPIAVADKDLVLSELRRRGIVALNFWTRAHPLCRTNAHPRARALRESIVALPVHQELRGDDLRRLVEAVREAQRSPAEIPSP